MCLPEIKPKIKKIYLKRNMTLDRRFNMKIPVLPELIHNHNNNKYSEIRFSRWSVNYHQARVPRKT